MTESRERPAAPVTGLPARLNMRRAFDIYVFGRNRNMPPETKESAVGNDGTPGRLPSGTTLADPGVPAGQVTVPERQDLRYDRGAGTWRDRDGTPAGG